MLSLPILPTPFSLSSLKTAEQNARTLHNRDTRLAKNLGIQILYMLVFNFHQWNMTNQMDPTQVIPIESTFNKLNKKFQPGSYSNRVQLVEESYEVEDTGLKMYNHRWLTSSWNGELCSLCLTSSMVIISTVRCSIPLTFLRFYYSQL